MVRLVGIKRRSEASPTARMTMKCFLSFQVRRPYRRDRLRRRQSADPFQTMESQVRWMVLLGQSIPSSLGEDTAKEGGPGRRGTPCGKQCLYLKYKAMYFVVSLTLLISSRVFFLLCFVMRFKWEVWISGPALVSREPIRNHHVLFLCVGVSCERTSLGLLVWLPILPSKNNLCEQGW